jgi:hypothetical protein
VQIDRTRQIRKIPHMGARHIGNATNLPFSPRQPVIIELRNAVEMDGVDRDDAGLA